ncbi:AMP-binding protein [Namhaeicola litoreus]|uniref:AMP-binding protein n=1 Tax=Namhaeicola litoreus TaxID=1052145 RepID=A0ABW3XYW3_9FLAO
METIWRPTSELIEKSNINKMMRSLGLSDYQAFWRWSVDQRSVFWEKTVEALQIPFKKSYDQILDISKGVHQPIWLKGADMNIVDACFQNDPEHISVITQNEQGEIEKISQRELLALTNQIANGFLNLALKKGDAIAIDMPMNYLSVAIYLAGIKAGLVVATIADSFTPKEISVRLKITQPKIIFTQDFILRAGKFIPLYAKIKESKATKAIVVKSTNNEIELRSQDIFFRDFISENKLFNSVSCHPEDPINILFSSGTTGEPKAIPWTHITPIKSASDGYYHQNIKPAHVVCWPTNLGWMMGPWLVFATLINKASIALYPGAPMEEGFGKFIENAKVTMLGVVPSMVRHWKSSGIMERFNWNSIQCFSSTGEVSNPQEMAYLMKLGGNKPVIEYCGGTEIGGGYVTSTMVQDNIPSTFSTQALGTEFVLLNEQKIQANKGEVFIIPPSIGLSNFLLNKNNYEVYYRDTPNYQGKITRRHGDELELLENGYYRAHGRVDDAMNLGGIKVSSVQIEEVLNTLDFVRESAAIAVSPENGGPSELVVFYVPTSELQDGIDNVIIANKKIKEDLNPLFKIKQMIELEQLPRTASGKIMRRVLRDQIQK